MRLTWVTSRMMFSLTEMRKLWEGAARNSLPHTSNRRYLLGIQVELEGRPSVMSLKFDRFILDILI